MSKANWLITQNSSIKEWATAFSTRTSPTCLGVAGSWEGRKKWMKLWADAFLPFSCSFPLCETLLPSPAHTKLSGRCSARRKWFLIPGSFGIGWIHLIIQPQPWQIKWMWHIKHCSGNWTEMITTGESGVADMVLVWYKATNYSQKHFLSNVASMCILKTRTWTIMCPCI